MACDHFLYFLFLFFLLTVIKYVSIELFERISTPQCWWNILCLLTSTVQHKNPNLQSAIQICCVSIVELNFWVTHLIGDRPPIPLGSGIDRSIDRHYTHDLMIEKIQNWRRTSVHVQVGPRLMSPGSAGLPQIGCFILCPIQRGLVPKKKGRSMPKSQPVVRLDFDCSWIWQQPIEKPAAGDLRSDRSRFPIRELFQNFFKTFSKPCQKVCYLWAGLCTSFFCSHGVRNQSTSEETGLRVKKQKRLE